MKVTMEVISYGFFHFKGVSAMERKRILDEHNKYRGIVQPAASNMLKLVGAR